MLRIFYLMIVLLFSACAFSPYKIAMRAKIDDINIKNTIQAISVKTHQDFHDNEFIPSSDIPENIIFIIADGTGIGQYTLLYYYQNNFAFSRFDHIGLVTTHPMCQTSCLNENKKVTDSASSGTALATGQKTYNGAIGVDLDTNKIKTIIEWSEDKGMSTGLVATSTVTHATPASFIAHVDYRKKEKEIATQMAASPVDVIFGGGLKFWSDSDISTFKLNNGIFIDKFDSELTTNKRVLGLFAEGALKPVHNNREVSTTNMAKKAIELLEKNHNGFFIMIEESQVDWGGHANSVDYIANEMSSLNDLVNYCLDYQQKNPKTLVVLTSDHECGGLSIHDGSNGSINGRFTSDYHSANFVPVFSTGPGSEVFDGFLDNTQIGKQLIYFVKKKQIN